MSPLLLSVDVFASKTASSFFSLPLRNLFFSLMLILLCNSTPAIAANWTVPSGSLDARAGSNDQQISVTSFGSLDIPTLNGSTGGSVDTAAASLELTLVNNNLLQFDALAQSSTNQVAQGSPNAEATTLFQVPFSIAEQARAILKAEVLNSGALIASVVVTSQPPSLTLGFIADTGGQLQSDSRILAPGNYQIAGSIFTLAENPGAQIGEVEGSLVITALSDLDGDLIVGASDLAFWEAGFGGLSPANFRDGDINGDLSVTGSDFLQWQREYGPVTVSTAVALAGVPEPASFLQAVIGLLGIFCFSPQINRFRPISPPILAAGE